MQSLASFFTSDTLILSAIQSVAEFLPISSTAHLRLVRAFLSPSSLDPTSPQVILQDLAMHLGTVLAVMVYFKNYFFQFFKLSLKPSWSQTLRLQLAVATLPIIFAALFIRQDILVSSIQHNTLLMACNFIGFGVLLYFSDLIGPETKQLESMTYKDAFFIGCAQCLSIFPGVSRSGITMTMGRFCGLQRKDATRFSLMLAVPTVLAATGWAFVQLSYQKHTYPWHLVDTQFYVSVALTFIGGLMSIHILVSWIKEHSFAAFMLYRIGLGLVLLKTLGVI
ncbi:MAG: undecaprenyl-diphosphate phosphatase [Alphaproteobacteria bacterium]|nr:undecaprenyl-diphosphate phosphatase [Alphaproteobacteria bacterium]